MRPQLAVQTYTVRDYTKTEADLAETLRRIRAIGYRAVQLSAVAAMAGDAPEVPAAHARRLLDDHGLACVATHRSWDDLARRTDAEIALHRTLGCDFTAIGGLPAPYKQDGADGYRRWVAEAQPVIARLKAAGIRFGYHNHAFEFERYGAGPGRRSLYDIFVEEGGPDLMLELDVYWAVHAGVDPVVVAGRAPGRLPVVHLKDKEMAGQDPVMAPVGEGNLDWSALLPALEAAGTQWYAVEQDLCRRDPFDCLKASFEYLQEHAGADVR